jgi:hypothetical protein
MDRCVLFAACLFWAWVVVRSPAILMMCSTMWMTGASTRRTVVPDVVSQRFVRTFGIEWCGQYSVRRREKFRRIHTGLYKSSSARRIVKK